MLVFFSPWRMLVMAAVLGWVAWFFIYMSIYASPLPHTLWPTFIFGVILALLALKMAWNAVRYIWVSWCAIMRGPGR